MLSYYGLVKVLRIKAYAQGAIRLLWIGEGKYPFGRLWTVAITPLLTTSSRVHSICSQYSVGTFCQACWTGVTEGLVLMVWVSEVLPMVLKEFGKAHFKATMSQTMAVEVGEVTFDNFALRADLGLVVGGRKCRF